MRKLHRDELAYTAKKALASNGRFVGPTEIEWDVGGSCEAPIVMAAVGRPSPDGPDGYVTVRPGETQAALGLTTYVRCRKCAGCLKQRRKMWTERARAEWRIAPRTWFGTLTLRPDRQYYYSMVASKAQSLKGRVFNTLADDDQFIARTQAIAKELTRYFKRLRKVSGVKFRYLLVAEAHKTGLPHFHVLLHECELGRGVKYAALTDQWTEGFSKWKLAEDEKSALYLCKYLSKGLLVRVRASKAYGKFVLRPSKAKPPRDTDHLKTPVDLATSQG